jgi:hypothetical protein
MKIMKRSVVFLVITAIGSVFFSCEKESQTVYTIKGRLLHTCEEGESMPSRMLVLNTFGSDYLCINPSHQTDTCITDGEGYFELRYSHLRKCEHAPSVDIEYPGWIGGASIITCIPKNTDVDLGNVYLRNKGDLIVTIHPGANSYTDQDTLRIEGQEIAGPFTQTFVLDTIKNLETIHGYNFCRPDDLIAKSGGVPLGRLYATIWNKGQIVKQFEALYIAYCEEANHVEITLH